MKKRGDYLDHRDHRLPMLKEAGTEEFRRSLKLNPMKQFDKEVGNEERVRKEERPAGNSPGIDFYPSSLFCFTDT